MIDVILGDKSNALSLARSIGLNGRAVHVLSLSKSDVCRSSRFVSVYHSYGKSADVLDALKSYDANLMKILYPTSDFWCCFISKNEAELKSWGFMFLVSRISLVEVVLDKLRFFNEFRASYNMPFTCTSDGKNLLSGVEYVIKPRFSFQGESLVKKGFRGEGEVDHGFIWQAKLTQDLSMHLSCSGVAQGGTVFAACVTSKVAEYPSPGGTATVVKTCLDESLSNMILEDTKSLLADIKYDGAFEVEFIFDNEKLWLLELNPRFWLQHQIFTLLGVNIPEVYRRLCLRESVNVEDCRRVRAAWVHEGAVLALFKSWSSVKDIAVCFFLGKKILAHWSFRDPMPFFSFLKEKVCGK